MVRDSVPSSEVVRARFAELDGLRALAALAFVIYETIRLAPPLGLSAAAARAAADASQSLTLFLALSGFALAYPPLAAMREDGCAYLDVGRFAVKRALRVYPAYLVTLALAFVLPSLAVRYGLPALAHHRVPHDAGAFVRNAFFAGDGLGNDAFVALGLFARCYAVFPLALLLWSRSTRAFGAVVGIAAVAGQFGPGHAWGLGAFVPFGLGIVAADLRAQNHRFVRLALPFAFVAAAAAVLVEPHLETLPGASVGFRIDPLWAAALAALVAGAAGRRPLEAVLAAPFLGFFGVASFAIALVTVPVVSFVLRQLTPSAGAGGAAVNAAVVAIVAGCVLWQLIDRWFSDASLRRAAAEPAGNVLDALLRPFHADRVYIGTPPAAPEPLVAASARDRATPETPSGTDLASLSQRTGSAQELAAEINETKRRLAAGLLPPAAPPEGAPAARPVRVAAEEPSIPIFATPPAPPSGLTAGTARPAEPRPVRLRIGTSRSAGEATHG